MFSVKDFTLETGDGSEDSRASPADDGEELRVTLEYPADSERYAMA